MIDASSTLILLVISGIIGFVLELRLRDLAKVEALLVSIPLLLWLLAAANAGMKIETVTDLNLWLTAFVTSLVPIILSYAGGSTGASLAKKYFV